MEDDLTWLARTEHEWPKDAVYVSRHENTVEWHYVELSFIGYGHFTRYQWLARRSELQNKPRFADHPDAKCFFQHESGRWFKNVESSDMGVDGIGWRNNQLSHRIDCGWVDIGLGEVLGDWRDTLERRPRVLSEPAVTARLSEATKNVLAAAPALMDEKFSIDRNDWFGRGDLPPVGCVCQFFSAGYDGDWFDWCIFHGKASCGGFIVEHHHRTSPERVTVVLLDPDLTKFRPIRTERDKAIDEMKQHCPYHGSWDTVGRIYAEALYDAGYRKQNLPAN